MSRDKFHKRPGTTDQGKEYENLLVAYYSLKLVLDKEVADFKISSNDDQYGNFDDLVVKIIWKNKFTEQYNIQAKHKQANKNKSLPVEALRAEKGKFSIKKHFEEFNERPSQHSKLILFTNRKLEIDDDTEMISGVNFAVCITHQQTQSKIDTSSGRQRNVYSFYVKVDDGIKAKKRKLQDIDQYKKFCNSFYLYTNQKNVNDVRDAITTLLQEHFKCGASAVKSYVDFVSTWSNTDGKKDKLTRNFVHLKLTECLLSPYVLTPCDTRDTEKSNLFKIAVHEFETTIIGNSDIATNFYSVRTSQIDLEVLNKTGLKYQIIPKYVKSVSEISRLQRVTLLWLLNESPLVLKVTNLNEELISEAIDLCQSSEEKRKFILLGTKKKYRNWKTFCTLSDLHSQCREIYDQIVAKFSCSFHGQKETSLRDIIGNDEEIRNAFTTDELILMMDGVYNFGGPRETLPDYYIERRLTKITIEYSFIDRFIDTDTIVISCNGKNNVLRSRFQDVNFLMIDESYDHIHSPKDSSTEFFNKYNVYFATDFCPKEAFQMICEKHPTGSCHHFQIDFNNNLEWIESCNTIDNLRRFRTEVHYIKEKNVNDQHKLNIICSAAGMGKSMMMSNFKNNYLSDYWVVKILLREHVTFFERHTDHEEFLLHALGKNPLTQFETKIFKIFRDKRKLILIWDGIDEVGKEVFDKVLNVIEKIRREGFIQWITARSNLKKILEERLNVFARQIKPFGKKDQEIYITKRLHSVVKDLNKLTEQILKKLGDEHLGVPLQIFMLTELYQHNDKLCASLLTHTFSVTDLFQYFVDEKFNFYYDKANIDLSNNISKQIIQEHKEQRLEFYQTVALKLCLPPSILSTLNLHNTDNFLLKIQRENDAFGILEVVNNVLNFVHRTYAEYFVALWLSKNYRKIPNLRTFFFEENFRGIRFMFDLIMAKECPVHVSVLNKNAEGVIKHLEMVSLLDQAGRSPLHVASSWGERHSVLDTQNGKKMTVNAEKASTLKGENSNYKQILELLVTKCNIKQKDTLFHYDCLQYADQSLSLAAVDTISKFHQVDFHELQNFQNLASVLYYVIKLDYINLWKNVAEIPYVETSSGSSLLHLCSGYNRPHFLPKLLKNKMYKRSINQRDQRKWAPIHYASRFGHLEMIKKLKQVGGDIDLGAKNGEDTPLFVAAQYGQLEVLKYLLENKVKVNASKKNGWTPLMIACTKLNMALVKILLEYGADVNMVNSEGYGPLYVAARTGDLQMVHFLISKNAKVDMVGKNGEGPLYIAAKLGHLKVAKLLILKNANVNAVKTNGWTPLMIATSYGHNQVVKLLLDNKAHCNGTVTSGSILKSTTWKSKYSSPLNICARNGNCKIAKMLILYGAEVNEDVDQKPLQSAVSFGHTDIVKLLMEHGAEVTPDIVRVAIEKKLFEMVELLKERINDSDERNLFKMSAPGLRTQCSVEVLGPKNNTLGVTRNKMRKWIIITGLTVSVIAIVLMVSSIVNYVILVK